MPMLTQSRKAKLEQSSGQWESISPGLRYLEM